MNKRIKKKKIKQYNQLFCHLSYEYLHNMSRNKYCSYQCPNCGWDALEADEELKMGKVLWQTGDFYDYSFEVEYKCPCCGTVFSYIDGN